MTTDALKLRATDPADLEVIAAAIQDAVVPIADMRFFAAQEQFALVVSRFRWEADGSDVGPSSAGERVNAGLVFYDVKSVRSRRLDLSDRTQVLELLTIQAADTYVDLVFAGGGIVRLEVAKIDCRLEDYGEPWPTIYRPRHAVDEGS